MSRKIRWGVLGVAKIAVEKVIPAMQQGTLTEIVAIASRDKARAEQAARTLGIPKAYGAYEELLADPNVEAVYNPLPNHLHVSWSARAALSRKHVLCEKPIALDPVEAQDLVQSRNAAGVKVGEAFMVHCHPQWIRVGELVRTGAIGDLRVVSGYFSYYNVDPHNVRNIAEFGGGGLMDIGCYPITLSRRLFGAEPVRVMGLLDVDASFGVDRLTSAILEFPSGGQCTFTCSTQLVPYQRMQLLGTRGRIEVEIPFNAPPDRPTRLFIDDGSSPLGTGIRVEEIPTCNQYTLQGDAFSRAILEDGPVPTSVEDAILNMTVIEAIFRSRRSGTWEAPSPCPPA